ncbi:MAG: MarR family transcriptional regulator [Chloroflexota bacterium]
MSQKDKNIALLHQIFHKIFVLLDDGDRRALKQANTTPSQFNLLRTLNEGDTQGLTITDISNRLLCTRGNATRMVQRLEKQKMVEIGNDPTDQRLVRVRLSQQGTQRLLIAEKELLNSITVRFASLEDESHQQLLTLLNQVAVDLEQELSE